MENKHGPDGQKAVAEPVGGPDGSVIGRRGPLTRQEVGQVEAGRRRRPGIAEQQFGCLWRKHDGLDQPKLPPQQGQQDPDQKELVPI